MFLSVDLHPRRPGIIHSNCSCSLPLWWSDSPFEAVVPNTFHPNGGGGVSCSASAVQGEAITIACFHSKFVLGQKRSRWNINPVIIDNAVQNKPKFTWY